MVEAFAGKDETYENSADSALTGLPDASDQRRTGGGLFSSAHKLPVGRAVSESRPVGEL